MSKQRLRLNELMRLANIVSAQDAQLNAMINLISHRTASPLVTDSNREMEFNALLPQVAQRLKISEDLLLILIENSAMLSDMAEHSYDQESQYIYKIISAYYQAQMLLVKFDNTKEDIQRIKNLALITADRISLQITVFYHQPYCSLYFSTKAADSQYLKEVQEGRIKPEQSFATRFCWLIEGILVFSLIGVPVASIGLLIWGLVIDSTAIALAGGLGGLLLLFPLVVALCFAFEDTPLCNAGKTYRGELVSMKSNAESRVSNLFDEFIKQVKVDDFVKPPSELEIAEARMISKPDPALNNGNLSVSKMSRNINAFFSNYPEYPNETKPLGPPPPYSPT